MTLSHVRASSGTRSSLASSTSNEAISVLRPSLFGDAELGQMAAQGVGQHRPLLDQQVAGAVDHSGGLLFRRLDGREAHVRSGHGLADRLGIDGIVLFAALEVRLHIPRWNQLNRVTQGSDLSAPVVGGGARLHADRAGRQLGEKSMT